MKLLKIEICNIASIAYAEIDFTKTPLVDESQFLITGKTGSGKSTILDAICLALYNKTPRMNIAGNARFFHNEQDLGVNDTRVLMRNNTAEAWSKVTFIDNNNETLIAKWYCYRARKKTSGKLQSVAWTLSTHDETLISTGAKEMTLAIESRIGLTFGQFCRTSMLAQGEFTKFLKANDSEKSDILEKLTGTDIYSEISKKIHTIAANKSLEAEGILRSIENIKPLPEEEIAELNTSIETLTKAIAEKKSSEENLIKIREWFNDFEEVQKKITEILAKEQEHNQILNSPEYKQALSNVTDWESSAEVRNDYVHKKELEKQLNQQIEKDRDAEREFLSLSAQYLYLKNAQEELMNTLQNQQAYLRENKDKKEIFNNLTLIKEQIGSIEEGIDSINNYKKECDTFNAEIAKIETTKEDNDKKLQEVEQKEKSKQEEIDALQKQVNGCDIESLRSRLKELDAKNILLSDLKTEVAIYENHCSSYDAKKEDIKNKLAQLEECNTKYTSACENEAKATEKFQVAETLYNKVKESGEKYLKDLRSRLSLDDDCPLCGQKIKNLLTDEDFENSIAPVREQLELAQEEHNKAKRQCQADETSLKVCQSSLTQLQKEVTSIGNKISSALEKLSQNELWSSYKDIENRVEHLEKDIAINEDDRSKVAQAIIDYTALINRINKFQDELRALTAEKDKQQDLIVKNAHKIELCKTEISNRKANIEKEETEIKDRIEEVTKVYGSNTWEKEWKENPHSWLNALTEEANKFRSFEERVINSELEIRSQKSDIENIQHSIDSILELRHDWKFAVQPIKADKSIVREWSALYANLKSVSDTINSLNKQITETNQKIEKYIQENETISFERLMELEEIGKNIQALKNDIENIKSETIKIDTTKTTYANDLKNLENTRPDMEEGVTTQTIIEKIKEIDEETDRIYSEIADKKTQIKQDLENKKQHAEKLKEYEEKNEQACLWKKLSDNFGSADGAKFRKIAQSFILNNMLMKANFYLRKFTTRYEMYSQEDSLEILVRDNEMAGIERPISNLSGGESFLLSLSLAMGLSSISNQAMAMDTIFIDEGFGTLDSSYLNTVIDALDQLHNLNGKRVGIISHVDSLKERITTQIQVNKIGNSHSEINVVSIL